MAKRYESEEAREVQAERQAERRAEEREERASSEYEIRRAEARYEKWVYGEDRTY